MVHGIGKNINTTMINVTCVDNGRSVKALLISQKPDAIVVELDGGLRLTLKKHQSLNGLFVGSNSGLEFQARLDRK
jgi:hypothetical protein